MGGIDQCNHDYRHWRSGLLLFRKSEMDVSYGACYIWFAFCQVLRKAGVLPLVVIFVLFDYRHGITGVRSDSGKAYSDRR